MIKLDKKETDNFADSLSQPAKPLYAKGFKSKFVKVEDYKTTFDKIVNKKS